MSFAYKEGRLHVEEVELSTIAEAHGTPCYVYSRAVIEANFRAYRDAFGDRRHQICYAVKANGNLAVLDILAQLGSAFDIVSVGELARVRAAGGDLHTVTFAGVGKTRFEMDQALGAGIACFNVESVEELDLLADVADSLGVRAPIAIRVNPDVDPKTHPYISTGLTENKFGVPMDQARDVYRRAASRKGLRIVGVACHIGSQLTSIEPIVDAASRVMVLVRELSAEGIDVEHIDIGGGLGIAYGSDKPPTIEKYVGAICDALDPRYEIIIEPGRSIVGAAGVLVTRVVYMKQTPTKLFAICDAAMTELIRPALYQAHHDVLPLCSGLTPQKMDLVGPVCETADFLARDRDLGITSGDLISLMDCGAYGFVMSSSYNARPRAAEVLVDRSEVHLARKRETSEQLFADEFRLPTREMRK
ncbi:MAG: diaminopimelate decarboxylase [Gammaproteobacteria bacterium]|jgi:diaminopimelate decarboxylase